MLSFDEASLVSYGLRIDCSIVLFLVRSVNGASKMSDWWYFVVIVNYLEIVVWLF